MNVCNDECIENTEFLNFACNNSASPQHLSSKKELNIHFTLQIFCFICLKYKNEIFYTVAFIPLHESQGQ